MVNFILFTNCNFFLMTAHVTFLCKKLHMLFVREKKLNEINRKLFENTVRCPGHVFRHGNTDGHLN